jgi:cell wall-associated NlpC family hydrolase
MILVPSRQSVVDEALRWVGTPYHPNARIRGAGTDCAMLLAEVYEQAGVLPHIEPGAYSTDFALHRSEEIYLGFMDEYGQRTDAPAPGDAALWKFGRCYSHAAILIGDRQIVHASIKDRAVVRASLDDAMFDGREPLFFTLWPAS